MILKNKNEQSEFYKKNGEGKKIEIINTRLYEFLEANGFYKMKNSDHHPMVRIENNLVGRVKTFEIKEFLKNYLIDKKERGVLEVLMRGAGSILSDNHLEFLSSKEIKFKRGTKNTGFFYFQNGYVEVTADDTLLKPLNELDTPIWRSKVIKHELTLKEQSISDFFLFTRRIAGEDEARFKALCTTIGYLLHEYKDPIRTVAVLLIDEKISYDGKANGRRGKSLLMRGIQKLAQNMVWQDGKNLKMKSNFFYQSVTPETEILYFDDVSRDFSLEPFYSCISGGISVEKKYQDEIQIPFEESPKIAISTNFPLVGAGGSSENARRLYFEVSDYYDENFSPAQDFGKRFFTEWNQSEWNSFYNFMINCLQLYLQQGLVVPKAINIDMHTLVSRSNEQFVEFAKAELSSVGQYEKDELLKNFKELYPGNEGLLSNTFTKWIAAWGEYQCKSLKVFQKQSNNKNVVCINHVQQ